MNNELTKIGQRLGEILKKRQIKPMELARRAGVSAATVSYWQKGKNLNFEALDFLCCEMEVSLNWLINGQGSMDVAHSEITQEEAAMIRVLRHIGPNISLPLEQLLDASLNYIGSRHTLTCHPAKQDIFNSGQTAYARISQNGEVLNANDVFYDTLGISGRTAIPANNINIYQFIAPDYISRIKKAIVSLQMTGISDYVYFEAIHQRNNIRLGFMAIGSLAMQNNELVIDAVIKPLNHTQKS